VLGSCLAGQRRYAEAETFLRRGHTALVTALGEDRRKTREARQRLAALYEAWGLPPEGAAARR
jgi:hypothetical protein